MARAPETGWASAIVIGCLTGIMLTAERLPEPVASHFGAGGLANGFSSRTGYLLWVVGLLVVVPTLTAGVLAYAARRFPAALSLPHRDYWLAPERREATLQYLMSHSAWLAALVALLVFAIHLLVVDANRTVPARLDTRVFLLAVGAFCVALAGWVRTLSRRFRRD